MDLGIKGRNALVCAASKGLGLACASALAREGVDLVVCARTEAPLRVVAEALSERWGVKVRPIIADVSTEHGRRTLLDACPDPDILVNNAGAPPGGDFRKFGREDWIKAFDLNAIPALELIRATIDKMAARKFGRVINITSSTMRVPLASILSLSTGSRAALSAVVATIARDFVRDNVTINNVLPGPFDTDRLAEITRNTAKHRGKSEQEIDKERLEAHPAKRVGRPEELGALCAFLCGSSAGYITGQNILIDGGLYPTTL